jgi:hypothetical protein
VDTSDAIITTLTLSTKNNHSRWVRVPAITSPVCMGCRPFFHDWFHPNMTLAQLTSSWPWLADPAGNTVHVGEPAEHAAKFGKGDDIRL